MCHCVLLLLLLLLLLLCSLTQPLQLTTWLSQHKAARLVDAVSIHANLTVQAAALRCSTTAVPTSCA